MVFTKITVPGHMKFSKYLLDTLGINQMPPINDIDSPMSLQISVHDSIKVPTYFNIYMVFGYYFAGEPNRADSLFNLYWPVGVESKDDYYKEIKSRIENDPNWPQILDSNW